MKAPQAIEKVEFTRHLTGAEIMSITKQIIGNEQRDPCKPMFYKEMRDKLGFAFTIGQKSRLQYQQLIIVPTRKSSWMYIDYFRINQTYLDVEILSQFWPTGRPSSVQFGDNEMHQAIQDFATKLRQHRDVR